jgi:hypothetical protein
MLDIIFISYDEPNADRNWQNLRKRFPHAKRVHGVKGIANAHIDAAKKASTTFFYVVDADAEILDTFKFEYKPTEHEAEYVHIWNAFNPAIGMDYGYGGVKLFSKKFFANVTTQLDFSTTLAKGIKLMPEIACVTKFNSDPFRAYRGAFREAAKLYVTTQNTDIPKKEVDEARSRLSAWAEPLRRCEFRAHVEAGARRGLYEAKQQNASKDGLMFINDHDLLNRLFAETYPEIDFNTDPTPSENNPMKHELFFTSRIASSLYDPFVLAQLPVTELRDAISDGQLLSKLWVIEELKRLINEGKVQTLPDHKFRVLIVGGWIGTLSLLMNSWELPFEITSLDLDERANRIAEKLNYDFAFKTVTADMFAVDYSDYDIIINTSSEHIEDIGAWCKMIPSGRFLVVQNNNYLEGEGHISNVDNSSELRNILSLNEVLYEGTRKFNQYDRYMLIGRT